MSTSPGWSAPGLTHARGVGLLRVGAISVTGTRLQRERVTAGSIAVRAWPMRLAFGAGAYAIAALFWLNATRYLPFIADDALISARYAERLLQGHGLTWAKGAPVEGYSNLLWVLLTAGLSAFGMDPTIALRVLGLFCMLATGWVVLRRGGVEHGPAPLLSLLLAACTAPIGVWTFAGLEQPLVALLLMLALLATFDLLDRDAASTSTSATSTSHKLASVSFGLLCWTRPDSSLFVIATVFVVALVQWKRRRVDVVALTWLALLPLAFVIAQLGFRLAYYGDWLPNTARVKVAFSGPRLGAGIAYVVQGWRELRPLSDLSLLALIFGISQRSSRARCLLIASNGLVWLVYLMCIGGDLFPARRHFVVVILLMTLTWIEALRLLQARRKLWLHVAMSLGVALLAWTLWSTQPQRASTLAAVNETWEHDGKALGLWLRDRYKARLGNDAVIAVTAAGSVAYWSKLDAIDMLGLNDRHIARHRPAHFGLGVQGHELGDADYVLDRKPDVIVFHTGTPPLFYIGEMLRRDPRFAQQYREQTFDTGPPRFHRGVIYVRRKANNDSDSNDNDDHEPTP